MSFHLLVRCSLKSHTSEIPQGESKTQITDSACKFKLSVFIDANQQGAHVFPFPGRLGISADHE